MTQVITPQQPAIQQYVAGLNQTTYVYPFLILQASDLNVYVTAPQTPANPVNDLVPSANYTVTGVGVTGGGTVVFNTAPAQGSTVTVARNMQLTITTQFNDAQTFNGQSLDNAFQRVVLMLQQLQGNFTINAGMTGSISRCLQYVVDTYLPNQNNSILPLLTVNAQGVPTDNQVWISQGGNITVATLANDNMSTLRGQLASQVDGADGASLIGYFDQNSLTGETLTKYLNTSNIYGVDTGSANALAFTAPALSKFTAYQTGMIARVLVANTNTGASTITISPAGSVNVKRSSSVSLAPGDMVAGTIAQMQYDGTEFLLLNPQGVTYYGADSSVAANTITVSVSPPITSYTTGFPVLLVKIANSNTGATTIAVNGLASKAVKLPNGGALIGGELFAGMIAEFSYDGTNMQLLNPARIAASNGDVVTGTNATRFVTPASLVNSFLNSGGGVPSQNSYTLPGGLIVKFGNSGSINSHANETDTFTTAFPTGVLAWAATANIVGAASITSVSAVAATTNIILYNTGAVNYPSGITWIVLGY